MNSTKTKPPASFLDGAGPATQLTARVVDVFGDRPRVHGYDLDGELSPALSPSDLALLTLTGELPDPVARRRFARAWSMLAAFGVDEPPTHAGLLATACGAEPMAAASTAMVVLCQRAGADVAAHRALLRWTEAPSGAPPTCEHGDGVPAAVVASLDGVLPDDGPARPLRDARLCRVGWALALSGLAGLRGDGPALSLLLLGRTPSVLAETWAAPRGDLSQIPLNVPPLEYVE